MEPLKWWERIIANLAWAFCRRWQCQKTLKIGSSDYYCQKHKWHTGKHVTYGGDEF